MSVARVSGTDMVNPDFVALARAYGFHAERVATTADFPAAFGRALASKTGSVLDIEISPEALASVREVEKRAKKLTLMELTERTCKWPIGDPATEDFWFCGLPSVPGKPYCEAHVGVAFQPMSARRDRRR